MFLFYSKFKEKLIETLKAVLPILIIVLLLCFSIAPIPPSILMTFLIGAVLLIIGMLFFNVGVELSMNPIGERVGSIITKSKNILIVVLITFIMGFIITISEPDLQVLAQQVPSIPNLVLIFAVAFGVAVFLVMAILRMLFGIPLSRLLLVFYSFVFPLAFLVPGDFVAIAFDSGGVTTGPMTVPFIMSFGIGIASIRSDKHAEDDSFGLVSLCSIGPILAVLILGMIYNPGSAEQVSESIPIIDNTVDLWKLFAVEFPVYIKEMALSILPIVLFFGLFQLLSRDINKRALIKIVIGLLYTYVGLILFLTGVNVGFMPAGNYLGQTMATLSFSWIIVIAEQGYTELIMNAARAAGAYGGTVIHAKGTGMEIAEKFMHMFLAAEKEVIYIVTKTEQKNPIMQAINKNAGPDSKAKAITFSLPVTDTAGLRLIED